MSYYRQGPFRPGGGSGVRVGVPGLTPVVKAIMIACAAVWLVQLGSRFFAGFALEPLFGLVPAAIFRGWLWQPFTYMFLHSPTDLFHLLFNMLMLWMFGGELERFWGSRAFLRYYVVCGVGAGLFAAVTGLLGGEQAMLLPTIGASGAIFGLFMAYGMVFAERTVLFMLIFPMKARTMALIMFALTFFYTISLPGSGVSHIAHLGGAVTGFLYLKRAWRIGQFYRELRWKYLRRRFKVIPPDDDRDRWVH
jgi:membrane associated rhomboid family serine protease